LFVSSTYAKVLSYQADEHPSQSFTSAFVEMHFSHSKFPANLETSAPPTRYSDVVIIGAGFSGINVACQLQRQLGVSDFTIYDRADEIGGAWAANKCKTLP
jgi:NADPH-dependent glutamate synthase beta subunit-like oxidoreductase